MSTVTAISHLEVQGARFYPLWEKRGLDGRLPWLPSATEVLKVYPKPALVTWAANAERAGILESVASWWVDGMDVCSLTAKMDELKERPLFHRQIMEGAQDLGSSAHAYLEWYLKDKLGCPPGPEPTLLPGAERVFEGAVKWMESVNLVPLDVEKRIYYEKMGYAGRYDLKAEIDWRIVETFSIERRVVIVDWKSSKGIYPDMAIQNIAYRQADSAMGNTPRSNGGVIVRLAKSADDKKQVEPVQVPYDPALMDTFKAALAFWRSWRQHEGKWTGGYASEEEVEVIQAGKRGRRKVAA